MLRRSLTTFHCPGGRLQIRFSPTQLSPVQSAVWEVVGGTGSFEGVRGGGTMVAMFGSENPDQGRETFTGRSPDSEAFRGLYGSERLASVTQAARFGREPGVRWRAKL